MKKQSKKFVLAGLFLLVIAMVLLPLSGCKMEMNRNSGSSDGAVHETISSGNPAVDIAGITKAGPTRSWYRRTAQLQRR